MLIYSGDLRESVFYGFPPDGDLAPAWESFSAFNSTGPRIEWRIETDRLALGSLRGDPPLVRQRRPGESGPARPRCWSSRRSGQMHERDGCAVGLVLATGNPGKPTTKRAGLPTSGRGISPAALTSGWLSGIRCRTSAAARTDYFFPRAMPSTIIFLAVAESYQPPILTHLPGSRSL